MSNTLYRYNSKENINKFISLLKKNRNKLKGFYKL